MNTFGLAPGDTPEPGIYINMAGPIYYGCPKSLGSSDLKAIALDPVEWQYDRLRKNEKDTLALTWGKALHARTLEGHETFKNEFACAPAKEDFPGCLITHTHLREHAKAIGVKSSGTKPELIKLIRVVDQTTVIWDELLEKFASEAGDKLQLSAEVASEVETAAQWMQRDPFLAPIMKEGVICAGLSEVSIFYEENGVRLKARLDHVLEHAILDLKSFRSRRQQRVDRAVVLAIGGERYDLQAAAYLRAWRKAKELFKAGKIFGADDRAVGIIKKALSTNDEDFKWVWIFVKNHGAPQPIVRELELRSFLFGASSDEVNSAIDQYRKMVAQYGLDKDWAPQHLAKKLGDEDFPAYMMQ